MAGLEVGIKNLSKSFGKANIWNDVTLTLPAGEISALLGPSGTGKSVLLKSIIGLLKPEKGSIFIRDTDLVRCSESKLYEIRKLFGVLFQDGALFGSMNLYDNIAFPLREHTRKGEKEISDIVMEKLDLVGLSGAEEKLPGEISGGMKKRAGLARALVLDPEIILVDEPDSGLDPVRTAYLNQLLVDLNTQLDATILVVTHHLGTARSMPDNIGMLFRRNLVMFGPREVLLTSEEPVVQQFLQGRRVGPIGMSEEKDSAQMEAEMAELKKKGGSAESEESFIDPQIDPTEGLGERKAVQRRKDRVMQVLHTLPEKAQTAILEQLTPEDQERYGISRDQDRTELIEITRNQPPEDADPFAERAMEESRTESMTEGSPSDEGGEPGSGDPDGDPEARQQPPAPPESDDPLIGVPADEYAGGTVVLPQAGEHTKDDSEDDAAGSEDAGAEGADSDGAAEDVGSDGAESDGAAEDAGAEDAGADSDGEATGDATGDSGSGEAGDTAGNGATGDEATGNGERREGEAAGTAAVEDDAADAGGGAGDADSGGVGGGRHAGGSDQAPQSDGSGEPRHAHGSDETEEIPQAGGANEAGEAPRQDDGASDETGNATGTRPNPGEAGQDGADGSGSDGQTGLHPSAGRFRRVLHRLAR